MRRLGLILLLLLGVTVGLALVEVALRFLTTALPGDTKHQMVADPLLHHRLRRNFTKRVRGVEFSTNSLGLHDREFSAQKSEGVFRILMLGDSFTEGGGLRLEDTVAKRVETLLNQGRCRSRHEVINAGMGSYSPILEYLLLKQVGLGLAPDLIVLNFDMTDVHDDFVRTAVARLDAEGLPVAVPPNRIAEAAFLMPPLAKPRVLRFLTPLEAIANRSAIYQAIRRSGVGQRLLGSLKLTPERLEALHLIGNIRYDTLAITRDGEFHGMGEAWALTERYLRATRRLAQSRGLPFVLVVYPHPHQVSAAESQEGRRKLGIGPGFFTSERPFQILEDLGQREGFPVINLLPVFRRRDSAEGPLFWHDDIHHTPQGAKVFADGLLTGLLKQKFLPQCGSAFPNNRG